VARLLLVARGECTSLAALTRALRSSGSLPSVSEPSSSVVLSLLSFFVVVVVVVVWFSWFLVFIP
jgi:hypothetical protein